MKIPDLEKFSNQIDAQCASRDRYRLQKSLNKIRQRAKQKQPVSRDIEKLEVSLGQSAGWVKTREAKIPRISYPELPIKTEADKIKRLLLDNQILVIAGETGSGKTTQLPKICLELGIGSRGLIGHTQPRRVAARSVAARIADELQTEIGSLVGYQVRFTDKSSDHTLVKLMTEGILLSEIQRDPFLNRYECIIIDEAHERSLNIDFLLGYLKRLLPRRPDLKLIITSATIDVARFSKHFDDAPVLEVSGRSYPVEIFYQPWEDEFESSVDAVLAQVKNIIDSEPVSGLASDILVFCPGERDIRQVALALRRAQMKNLEILPLYSRLSIAEQDRIFRSSAARRVVLATNVAETSLTVPGIGYVIDTGTARISRYSVRTKVQRLPIEPVSQASANQRAGRCGRIAEGVCIRLYSEQDFLSRPEFTSPEILRTNLASVILQMQYLRLGNIQDFPFVERPSDKQIRDGFRLLEELSFVDTQGLITRTGRSVAGLPVDPRFARMLWQAQLDGCLAEVITIVSYLSVQEPKERPADKQQQADERHRIFMDPESDFIAILNLWHSYQKNRQELSNRKLDAWCRQHFLSPLRMREWREVHHQLSLMARERQWKINSTAASYKVLHRALLSGLVTQIGMQHENKEFLGARNRQFRVFPGSNLAKKPPKWIFAAQMLETGQLFAHQVARVNPEWLLGIADHLLQRDYYEPYYHVRRGEIMARMRYTLYGLVVSDHHRVSYKSIDPEYCHELFIREALANWKFRSRADFYQFNRKLCERLQELEDRTRSRDLVVDEQQLYEFYAERIPPEVVDQNSFESWRNKAEHKDKKILYLDEDLLMNRVDQQKLVEFPDTLEWQGQHFRLSYQFNPGSEEDGVTLHVPIDQLHQIPDYLPQWLVPGILKDKLIAIVKALPKAQRKTLVPIPAQVEKILPYMETLNEPLLEHLAHQLQRLTGKDFSPSLWDQLRLDDFYLMRFQLEDADKKVLTSSRNLKSLRSRYRDQARQVLAETVVSQPDFPDSTDWSFGDLPEYLDLKKGRQSIRLWPALVDKSDRAGYQLFDNPFEANSIHQKGVVRLFLLQQLQSVKYLNKEMFKGADLKLMSLLNPVASRSQTVEELRQDIILAVSHDLLVKAERIRSEANFKAQLDLQRGQLVNRAMEIEVLCLQWADELRTIKAELTGLSDSFSNSVVDIGAQIEKLFFKGFIARTPREWRPEISRFLKGIERRIQQMQGHLSRDEQQTREIGQVISRYDEIESSLAKIGPVMDAGALNNSLVQLRWLIEEYRISLFSQPIKTRQPVSLKRLETMFEQLEQGLQRLQAD